MYCVDVVFLLNEMRNMLCGIYVSATFAVSHSLVITLAYYYGDNVELSPVFHSAFCLLSSYSSDVRAEQSARYFVAWRTFFFI